MVEDNAAADLRRWTDGADPDWLAGVEMVVTDLAESFRAGLSPHLDHATRVADPFHVIRVAQPLCGQGPPAGPERDAGTPRPQARTALSDPQAVARGRRTSRRAGSNRTLLGPGVDGPRRRRWARGWPGISSGRLSHRRPHVAATLLDKAIAGCGADDLEEIRSLATRWSPGAPRSSPITAPAHRTGPPKG